MHMNFAYDAKMVPISPATAAGTGTITSAVVDMQGFDSVALIVYLGDVDSGSVLTLTGNTNDVDSTSGGTALAEAATFTAGASDADDGLMVLDLHMPREQYVFATLGRASADAAVNGMVAILYNAHQKPTTQDAKVGANVLSNDPAPAEAVPARTR